MEDDAQSTDLVRAAFGAGHPVPSRPAVVMLDGGGIPQQSLMRELQSSVRRHANRERARPHRHRITSSRCAWMQQLHKRDSRIAALEGEVRQHRDRDGLVVVGASVTSREPNFIGSVS
jgi:hypothetical protein